MPRLVCKQFWSVYRPFEPRLSGQRSGLTFNHGGMTVDREIGDGNRECLDCSTDSEEDDCRDVAHLGRSREC
jgi:hypothetical protein